jgi:hypothetical protein
MEFRKIKYGLNICLTAILFSYSNNQVHAKENKFSSDKTSCNNYIIISGESNINQFEFIWSDEDISEPQYRHQLNYDTTSYKIAIPVKDFKARNSLMYNDFLQLMKANDYPKIVIKIAKEQIAKLKEGSYYFYPDIQITIAGVSKVVKVPCYVIKCIEGKIFINGVKRINLTDFKMTPPSKLQGLVKVRDEINVDFGLIITFNDSFQNIVSR